MKKKIIWSDRAKQSLKYHHDFIKKDSVAAARRVKKEIIQASKALNLNPEKYQLDEYFRTIREIFEGILDGATELFMK